MKKLSRFAAPSALLTALALPLIAAAQSSSGVPTGINLTPISHYSNGIVGFINGILVPILMAIAFIVFLWGVYKYFILGATDEKSRMDGRQFTLWGIIGFVVILSVWGLVYLVMSTFGLSIMGAPPPPSIWGSLTGGSTGGPPPGSFGSPGTQTYNSSIGATNVTSAQQTSATNAYQNCMANGGTGPSCQAIYNQILGVPSGQTGTTQSTTASQGQGCTGDSGIIVGVCEPSSSCSPANTDTSATCATGGFICCAVNSGTPQTGGGVGEQCETQGCASGLECVLGGNGTHICAQPTI